MIDPAVAHVGHGRRGPAQLDHGQGGGHVAGQGDFLPKGAQVDGVDHLGKRRLPGRSCRRRKKNRAAGGPLRGPVQGGQALQGCPAGNITSVQAAQAVGHGKDAGRGQKQQAVLVGPAHQARMGQTGTDGGLPARAFAVGCCGGEAPGMCVRVHRTVNGRWVVRVRPRALISCSTA